MIILIISIILKLLIQKLFSLMKIKIDKVHIYSTIVVLIITNTYCIIYNHSTEYIVLISSILILLTYCLVNIPGAYLTSIRIRIFELVYKNNSEITLIEFDRLINDKILFEERFQRLKNFNLLLIENDMYQLNSNKLLLLIKFVKVMKLIFKKLNRY